MKHGGSTYTKLKVKLASSPARRSQCVAVSPQHYVSQVVTRGVERQKVQPGSVTFIQRFGSALNPNMYYI
jgi:hypothetical protein